MDFTLYEYELMSYQNMNIPHGLIDGIEALNHQHRNTLVEVGRHGLKATQFVGMLQTPHGTLNILPKIDCGADKERGALQNLVTMLCYAYDVPLLNLTPAPTQIGRGGWLEVLTQLFCQLLYRELRQGIEHLYVQTEERSPALKGRWLIERQLTRAPHIRHAFEVCYDDFSPDTRLNQIFAYATDILLGVSKSPENRRLLVEIQSMLGAAALPVSVTPDDLKAVTFTRLNERFKPAFQIARLLIESMTQVLRRGESPLWAFMFDMNHLFESFVAGFLTRHWREIAGQAAAELSPQAQMRGEKHHYLAQDSSGKGVFRLIPDLVLRGRDRKPRLIIDTKYKRLTRKSPQEADMYQMVAYAGSLSCRHILLLYPSTAHGGVESRFTVPHNAVHIDVQTLNLHQSLADSSSLISDFRTILAPYLMINETVRR